MSDVLTEIAGPGARSRVSERAAAPEPRTDHELVMLVLAPAGCDAQLIERTLESVRIASRCLSSAEELIDELVAEIEGTRPPQLAGVFVTDDGLGLEWSHRLVDELDRQPSWSQIPIILLAQAPVALRDSRWLEPPHLVALADRLTSRPSVTVVDRPTRVATLISAARAAVDSRQRQLEVRDLIKKTEEANQAKSEFLAMMSHELRTPLNAIMGYVNLLEEGCYGPITREQGGALGRIERAQRHLLGLINDILNFTRLEKAHVEYTVADVRLADVVAGVAPLVEPQIAAKDLRYRVGQIPDDLFVRADAEKLGQILINLLSNAIKYTPSGGTITLEVVQRADGTTPRDRVFLRAGDTGPGIPDDKLSSVFEPFVQLSKPTVVREGTGLGLAISRGLARGMGGDLRARSQVGVGSTFTVDLERA